MLLEELLDHPHERIVVLRAVDLRHEGAALLEVLGGHPQGVERDLVLLVRVLFVSRTDVGGAVAENDVRLSLNGQIRGTRAVGGVSVSGGGIARLSRTPAKTGT